jgi:hypothetical protein
MSHQVENIPLPKINESMPKPSDLEAARSFSSSHSNAVAKVFSAFFEKNTPPVSV